MVSCQNGLVSKIPLGSDLRAGDGTDTRLVRPVLTYFLAVHHDTVTRFLFGIIGVKTTIDVNTGVNLKGGVKHRTAGSLRGLRRHIGARCDIDRTGSKVVISQIFLEVVDSVLDTVLGVRPTASVVVICTCRPHVADSIRLRIRTCACPHEQY